MDDQIDRHDFSFALRAPRVSLLRIIVSLGLAAVLAACSAVKLGYASLPNLGYWWLDGYVDLGSEQGPRVRDELVRLQAWHRANELPLLADLLGRMEQLAPGSVSPAQACGFAPEVLARLDALAQQAAPAIVAIGATLTPRQLRHIERKFASKNAEWRAERIAAPAEERLDKRYREWLDRMEMFYGTPEPAQAALLRQLIARSPYDPVRTFEERKRRQQDLLQVLRKLQQKPDAAQARALVHGWFERVQRPPDAAARRYQDSLIEELCRNVSTLHETASPEQRARAARRLQAYRRDFLELAAGPR
jgi:hypothetical protein